jgi:hypothetical protein
VPIYSLITRYSGSDRIHLPFNLRWNFPANDFDVFGTVRKICPAMHHAQEASDHFHQRQAPQANDFSQKTKPVFF